MRQFEYAKISMILKTVNPDLFQEIVEAATPELKDITLIRPMYHSFCQTKSPEKDYMDRLIFISAILKLFCPSALFLNAMVTRGICSSLTEAMGYNHKQSISYFISQAKAYIKNPNFREKVEHVSKSLKEGAMEVA